jgi:hypothetical protein
VMTDVKDLIEAAESGNSQAIEAFVGAGIDIDTPLGNGETALMRAAAKGNAATVELLLDSGANVNARRHDGLTPLIRAAFFGKSEVVGLLLHRGADPYIKDRLGLTALDWASSKGHMEVVRILREGNGFALTRRDDSQPEVVEKIADQDESRFGFSVEDMKRELQFDAVEKEEFSTIHPSNFNGQKIPSMDVNEVLPYKINLQDTEFRSRKKNRKTYWKVAVPVSCLLILFAISMVVVLKRMGLTIKFQPGAERTRVTESGAMPVLPQSTPGIVEPNGQNINTLPQTISPLPQSSLPVTNSPVSSGLVDALVLPSDELAAKPVRARKRRRVRRIPQVEEEEVPGSFATHRLEEAHEVPNPFNPTQSGEVTTPPTDNSSPRQ